MNLKAIIEDCPPGPLICLLEARLMLGGFMSLLRVMNPGVCTMSLFADYVKFCAKLEGQGVAHLVECKYKIKIHRQQ